MVENAALGFPRASSTSAFLDSGPRLLAVAFTQGGQPTRTDRFLEKMVRVTGFPSTSIQAAISAWANTVSDPYGRGLVLIHNEQFKEALPPLIEAVRSAPFVVSRLIPLAYAEYRLGDKKAAAAALQKVLAVQPNDDILRADLAAVQ